MPRGQTAKLGTERQAKNGYWYVKVEKSESCPNGWKLKHHLVAERILGRPLQDEQARFKDGNIENFNEDNIEIVPLGKSNLRRRVAQLDARIVELTALRDSYQKLIDKENR